MNELDLLQKKINREIKARKQAEKILEDKSLELFSVNEKLKKLNTTKDAVLEAVSKALTVLFQYEDLDIALKSSLNIFGPKSNAKRVSIILYNKKDNDLVPFESFEWSLSKSKSLLKRISSKKSDYLTFITFCNNHFLINDSKNQLIDKLITNDLSYIDVGKAILFPIYHDISLEGLIIFEPNDEVDIETESLQSILRAFAAGVQSAFERNSSKSEILKQKQFYENVLNSIPSDLVVFNPDHTYKFINPLAVKDTETRNWMIDKDDFEYVKYRNKPVEIAQKRREVFNKVLESKEASFFEEHYLNKEGNEEWKHRILYPVFNDNSEIEMVIGYAIDITDIKKTQLEKESISHRLNTLISSLNSGILLEDESRNILVTNEEFCSTFSISAEPDQLVGINCTNSAEQSKHLIRNPDEFVRRIHEIVERKEICLNEEVLFKNGKIYERDFIPIFNDDIYLGHLWEYRNITPKKIAEKMLIKAREEAEESKRLKQRFLANMSHEIRTPMNGVIGIVHLLERTTLDANQSKYLKILRDSSEHLLHIINDILDVSKIEEGKLNIVYKPIRLETVIEGVIQNLKSRIKDKNLKLEISGLDIFKSHLLTDAVRLRQILLNLVSNAIKFTHKGKVEIKCTSVIESEYMLKFTIDVIDTGIGIPEDRIANIFNAFDQLNLETSAQYGGTGLGLNIVYELVQKMGGEINVSSKQGKGSTFSVTLSLDKVEVQESPLVNSKHSEIGVNSLVGKKILVVDDHEVNLLIANEIMSIWGPTVLYAKDGEEALYKVIEHDIDLVLMDMQMPNIDGIEATKMIRILNKPKCNVPIIAMTAAALPEEREKCLQSGMNDYISKPYNPKNLYDILSNHLLNSTQTNDPIPSKNVANNKDFDLTYLKELSGNSSEFILNMILSFSDDMPEMIKEMSSKLEKNEVLDIAQIAHKAKSLASYLGCSNLRALMIDIEHHAENNADYNLIKPLIAEASTNLDRILIKLKKVELE